MDVSTECISQVTAGVKMYPTELLSDFIFHGYCLNTWLFMFKVISDKVIS